MEGAQVETNSIKPYKMSSQQNASRYKATTTQDTPKTLYTPLTQGERV